MLASRFASAPVAAQRQPAYRTSRSLGGPVDLCQVRHASRSARYTYIPTIEVLAGPAARASEPFMVCQTRVRDEAQARSHQAHDRLRHADQITGRGPTRSSCSTATTAAAATRCWQE